MTKPQYDYGVAQNFHCLNKRVELFSISMNGIMKGIGYKKDNKIFFFSFGLVMCLCMFEKRLLIFRASIQPTPDSRVGF